MDLNRKKYLNQCTPPITPPVNTSSSPKWKGYSSSTETIVDATLHLILIKELVDKDSGAEMELELNTELALNAVVSRVIDHISQSSSLMIIKASLSAFKSEQSRKTRKGRLWMDYKDIAAILRNFPRNERIGQRKLHLQTVSYILPYLTAYGNNNYTKSAKLYQK